MILFTFGCFNFTSNKYEYENLKAKAIIELQ